MEIRLNAMAGCVQKIVSLPHHGFFDVILRLARKGILRKRHSMESGMLLARQAHKRSRAINDAASLPTGPSTHPPDTPRGRNLRCRIAPKGRNLSAGQMKPTSTSDFTYNSRRRR
jgi:hypothetical protein